MSENGMFGSDPFGLNKKKRISPEQSNALEKSSSVTKNQKMAAAKLSIDAAKESGLIDTTSVGGGAIGGAASGAMTGAMVGGVPGAIIGGAVGGITGGLNARSARKKAEKEAEAQMHKGLAGVASDKADRLRQAFASMGALMKIT